VGSAGIDGWRPLAARTGDKDGPACDDTTFIVCRWVSRDKTGSGVDPGEGIPDVGKSAGVSRAQKVCLDRGLAAIGGSGRALADSRHSY